MEELILGELTERKIGYGIIQPGESTIGGVPVIKVNNIISGLKSIQDLDTTHPENDQKYRKTRLNGGEIIISVVGTIGKTAIVPMDFKGCNLVRATALIDIKDPILSRWVKYYIDSPKGQSYINGNLNTTVQPTLNIKSLVEMPIPFYGREYAEKVVAILSKIDDKIENNRKINDNLEQQAQALYKSWFVDFEPFKDGEFVESEMGEIPVGWTVVKFSDLTEIPKKTINPQKFPETIFKHYSLPACDNGLIPENQTGIDIMSNKIILQNNTTLFSKLNPKIKRIWFICEVQPNSICSTEFIPYRATNENESGYIFSIINSESFYAAVMGCVNGATGSHQRFHAEDTDDFLCAYNKEAVNEFSQHIDVILKQMHDLRQENVKLASMRDTLLPKLMSGELKINEIDC